MDDEHEKRLGATAQKPIRLGLRTYDVSGHSEADPYFRSIANGSETGLYRLLVKNLQRDAVALDIGANIGITSLVLSQVLDHGRVYSFEPGARNFALLQKNLAANGVTNVVPAAAAMADTVGTLRFAENSAYGGMVSGYRDVANGSYEVPRTTVDTFVRETDLSRLDLMKVDVEGQERLVLDGAAGTIKRFNPYIYLEFNVWTLLAYGAQNPLKFLEELVQSFDTVAVVDPTFGEQHPVVRSQVKDVVHSLMMTGGCVCDLLLVADASQPRDTDPVAPGMAQLLSEAGELAMIQREEMLAQRDALLQERDAIAAERDRLLASPSWRVTAPMRRLSRQVRGIRTRRTGRDTSRGPARA